MEKISINTYLDNLHLSNRDEILRVYGEKLFDILYPTDYHNFIKTYLTSYNKDHRLGAIKIAYHIDTFYRQRPDSEHGRAFSFHATGDGTKIRKIPSRTARTDIHENLLQSIAGKKDLILTFDCNPDFKKHYEGGLKQRIITALQNKELLAGEYCENIPMAFDFVLHRDTPEEKDFLITDSPF